MTERTFTLVSHHLCPYVQRAAIALEEKGVGFERIYIDLSAKPDWFLGVSPLGKVPLLRIDDSNGRQVLFESAAICEFLEEVLPGPRMHPTDPFVRARHRGWMEFGSNLLADIWVFETTIDTQTFAAKRQALASKFVQIEAELHDGGPFFGGVDFSLVDAVFAPIFRYFDVFDTIADHGVFDGLMRVPAWRRSLAARASVRSAVTADYPERLMDFLRKHNAIMLKGGSIAA
ncbi:glutathione S-transferase family protein [Rhizobium sp. ARZ01]|uniref:glutathione S-transferase family protein n=1 Tax=Rhizobium sp. ARZ01 TaxID=2769313 RepID=UPI0017863476|nr:glutathione S-transferase family protein [Rhizobium sp. ARZ01]MBD9374379.1 glutathione S-transferase family protein [Rhizobium sp. ARZ01]